MTLAWARLTKFKTADSMVDFRMVIPASKLYLIDLDTQHTVTLWNVTYNREHTKEIVFAVENGKHVGWLPTECLEIEKGDPC